MLEVGDRLWRVQVKWGRLSKAKDAVIVELRTSRCIPSGYVRTMYTADEIDLFAVYCGELDRCFLLPIDAVVATNYTHLRLKPPRNGQRACNNLAEDFDFEGAVAQLARARRWQRRGRGFESLQLHSSERSPLTVGCDDLRDHQGYRLEQTERGEHMLITRRGRPLAMLSPPPSPPQLRPADPASAPAPG